MKAQDYADIYNRDGNDGLKTICDEFIRETARLVAARKAKEPTAILAVIREQGDKWKAFARRIGGKVTEDGYLKLMRLQFPEIAAYI